MLSDAQIAGYLADGYIVLPGFKPAAEIAALCERARQIVDAFEPSALRSIFTTHDHARTSNVEFLASADRVHCFFEEEAFDAQGQLRQTKAQSINKIGHALHDLDPVFQRFSHGPELAALARDLGLLRPQLWQSMFIFKPPGIGGEVKWHQDATFLQTSPCTVTGFWFALEDATRDNGCLWVQPGGQRSPLRERFVREGDAVRMEVLATSPWPGTDDAVPVEVQAGTLVCFHGLLPHYSAPNRSAQSRHAYTLHAVDASSHWAESNWMRRRADLPLRGFV
jgi:phytanoyl-CoA hydroxylase